jgi:hypothetical protein
MAGTGVANSGRAWRGWQVAACFVLLSLPAAAEAPKTAPPPGQMMQLSMEPMHQRIMDATSQAAGQIAEVYRRSPVLVMGLALAGALPLLAGLFAVGRAINRRATGKPQEMPTLTEPGRIADKAWIDVGEGHGARPVPFAGEILRIGRHSDNDIALDHDAVHRHHALIQRTPDEEFVLMDLTGGTGNQPMIDGRPVARAILHDGDRIVLGDTILTFHLGVETPAAITRPDDRQPTSVVAKELTDDERDAGDEPAGRAADGIETRRIKPSDRVLARGAGRGRA